MDNARKVTRVGLVGPVFWTKTLAGQLQESGLRVDRFDTARRRLLGLRIGLLLWLARQIWRRTPLHFLGGSRRPKLALLTHLTRTRLVYHWIGSDAMDFVSQPAEVRARSVRRLKRWSQLQLADSPEIAEELRSAGLEVDAVIRLLPTSVRAEILPWPAQPSVLGYWSDERADFHRAAWVLELARRFPQVRFQIAAATGGGLDAPPNVQFLGWCGDLHEVYRQNTVFLRLPRHDSISTAVLEALARGRYVIYTREMPHCRCVQTLEQAHAALAELLQARGPNEPGARYVREHFDPQAEMDKLLRLYQSLVQ